MNYIIRPVNKGYYKIYFDGLASDFEIQQALIENKMRFIRNDTGLFDIYKIVILAEKLR